MEDPRAPWDRKIDAIARRVKFVSLVYLALGIGVYGVGGTLLFILIPDKLLATSVCMFFFQLCLIYFGTQAIFRHIALATRAGLEANRDTIPAMERLARVLEKVETKLDDQTTLDIQEEGRMIRGELTAIRKALTRPIVPPVQKIVAPLEGVTHAEAGKGPNGS